MLVILGRPGYGCTTLFKLLGNLWQVYAVEGDAFFGVRDHQEAEQFWGQIVMNTDEEISFPTMAVGDAMDFATKLKFLFTDPKIFLHPRTIRRNLKEFFLQSMGISYIRQ